MPTRPRFPRWSDLRPPRTARPLTALEEREHHAIRLAFLLAMGMVQNTGFTAAYQPIPGGYWEQWDWLRATLQPLARQSPTIRMAVRLINQHGPSITWDEPATVKRHLFRMRAEVPRLAQMQVEAPRHRSSQPPTRRPGRRG